MSFSEEYEDFKKEINANSQKAFQALTTICPLGARRNKYSLIDLGCGTRGVPAALTLPMLRTSNYIGIEQFDRETKLEDGHFEKLSYLDGDWTRKIQKKLKFDYRVLVSTFSLDVYPTKHKRKTVFKQANELNVDQIITSGFFYEGNLSARITELDITVSPKRRISPESGPSMS